MIKHFKLVELLQKKLFAYNFMWLYIAGKLLEWTEKGLS